MNGCTFFCCIVIIFLWQKSDVKILQPVDNVGQNMRRPYLTVRETIHTVIVLLLKSPLASVSSFPPLS